MTGPSNATVQYFNYAQNSTSSYQLLVQWDEAYRGNVTVDLQTNRWVQLPASMRIRHSTHVSLLMLIVLSVAPNCLLLPKLLMHVTKLIKIGCLQR